MPWLDEVTSDYEPKKELEPFYILAALEFGDPDVKASNWRSAAFRNFWRRYQRETKCYRYSAYAVDLQYFSWYERNRPVDKPAHQDP